jgi:uncharacterized repeat protein (TIGR01451 family)
MKWNQIFSTMLASLLVLAPEISHAAAGTTLAIGKTSSTSTAIVGQMISFQVVVTNLGPLAASSATVSDVLPSGLQYVYSTGPGTYAPSNGQWDLVPGKIGAISILTIQVEATNAGVWLNTAKIISSTPPDLNSVNNSASVSVTVNQTPPIVLTCSSNLTITASTPNGTNVYFTTSAYGGCSSPLNLSSVPPSGSTFPIGTTVVTTTASDNCGDSTNCSFTITVNKQTYPPIVLTCSSNLTITASTPNGTNVYFTTSAYGGCSSPLNLSSSPPSGSTFPIGTTTVTTTASDSCGDSTNCSFTITVNKQTYPPIVLTCSSNLTITASTPNGTNVYFTTSAYGGCSSPLNLSSSPPSGSTFPIGTTTVTTTASDSCGDSTNCSFTITVNKPVKFTAITLIHGGIKLDWLTNLGFVLQQNGSLGTTNWTPVTNTPTIINGQNELILSPTNVRGFYRLVNP